MRRHWVLILVGVALIGMGIGWAWYYAVEVYPGEAARANGQCQPYQPCPSFAPVYLQRQFATGEGIAVVGLAVLTAGAIWGAFAPSKDRRAKPR